MAYGTIGTLLRSALNLPEVSSDERTLEQVQHAASELSLSRVDRDHLAEMLRVRFPDSRVASLEAHEVALNNQVALQVFFTALARRRPCLLVLEDMHWGDRSSVEAVQGLVGALEPLPSVILLLYRPGFAPPSGAREIVLEELEESALLEVLESHLGRVESGLLRMVRERAGGNPFYVEELIRHFLELGIIGPSEGGWRLSKEPGVDDVPPGIEPLIAARLDRLGPAARRVAQSAAVIGRSFQRDLLLALPGLGKLADEGLRELEGKEIVSVSREEPYREYEFKHTLTRDAAYAGVLESGRRRLHREVADAIARTLGAGSRDALLAHHREQAGQITQARRAYLAGAREAVARFALADSEPLYRSYQRLARGVSEESVEARLELASHVLHHMGRVGEAETEVRAVIEQAQQLGLSAIQRRGISWLGVVLNETGRREEAWEVLQAGYTMARELGDLSSQAQLLGNLGNILFMSGRIDEAIQAFERALAIHIEDGNRPSQALCRINMAGPLFHKGRSEEAKRVLREALTVAQELKELRLEALAQGNLALMFQLDGRVGEALELSQRAITLQRELGLRRAEGIMLVNLAGNLLKQGRWEEALDRFHDALGVAQQVRDKRLEVVALSNLAFTLCESHRFEEATEYAHRAIGLAEASGEQGIATAAAYGSLGNSLEGLGELEEAQRVRLRVYRLLRDSGDVDQLAAALLQLARLDLVLTGEASTSGRRLDEVERVLEGVDASAHHLELEVMRGHLALVGGLSATPHLTRVGRLLEGREDVRAQRLTDALRRAQAEWESGQPLVRGHRWEDLGPGVRRWLTNHGDEELRPASG